MRAASGAAKSSRARVRASALGTHVQDAARVHVDQGSAAAADGVDVERRNRYRASGQLGLEHGVRYPGRR